MAFVHVSAFSTSHHILTGHAVSLGPPPVWPFRCFPNVFKRSSLQVSSSACRQLPTCTATAIVELPIIEGQFSAMMKLSSAAVAPFGDFFVDRFGEMYPKIASHIPVDQTALAANVYLFRFDDRLSSDFIRSNIDAVSRILAQLIDKSIEDAKKFLTNTIREAARVYFAGHWDDISHFIDANTPLLLTLRRLSTQHVAICDFMFERKYAGEVDPMLFGTLQETGVPIIAFVFAKYCSTCERVRPIFEKAAQKSAGDVLFVSLNGPLHPQTRIDLEVDAFPAIVRVCDNEPVVHFPSTRKISTDNIMSFAHAQPWSSSSTLETPLEGESQNDYGHRTTEKSLFADILRQHPEQWVTLLKERGIDKLEVLADERNTIVHQKIAQAIQCEESSCRIPPRRDFNNGEPLPLCILLGGGMGAGKTTIRNLISSTAFWGKYGESVVMVEADAFKHDDPLFQILQGVTPLASRIVHKDSIVAAEELFLKAVNGRRDIVFDGTLSWCEYARQTVQMLRDTQYYYRRGPGFIEKGDGKSEEVYWVRGDKRDKPATPYRIELVGVTAEAEISVMRGIVRRITTGRGVAISDQLKSHALFSQNFEQYLELVDSAYLFDTTLPSAADANKDYASQLVGLMPGSLFEVPGDEEVLEGKFSVRFAEAYSRFLQKRSLNINASHADGLYKDSADDTKRTYGK